MKELQAHKDRAHSKTGASGMAQWKNCPGSVKLCEDPRLPSGDSSFAQEGTIAHEAAEHFFKKGYYPRTEEVTNEMIEALDVYTGYVHELIKGFKPHPDVKILHELKFAHPQIHPGFRGTADTVLYDAAAKTLHVIDYKHGAGESVDAENNLQLMYYGIGAALTFKVGVEKVILTIVQPRIASKSAISSWEIPFLDLVEFQADIVRAIEATEEKDAPLVPGEKQCRWCRAKPICPALRAQTKELVLEEFSDIETTGMHMMSSERLGKVLSSVDLIESWCKSIKSFAYQEAVAGRIPDGFKLVPKRATRKWTDLETTKKALGMLVNANTLHDCYTEPELKSPAQVEKVIGGGKAAKDIVEPLVSAVSSGDTLVSIEDSREPTNRLASILQAFDE